MTTFRFFSELLTWKKNQSCYFLKRHRTFLKRLGNFLMVVIIIIIIIIITINNGLIIIYLNPTPFHKINKKNKFTTDPFKAKLWHSFKIFLPFLHQGSPHLCKEKEKEKILKFILMRFLWTDMLQANLALPISRSFREFQFSVQSILLQCFDFGVNDWLSCGPCNQFLKIFLVENFIAHTHTHTHTTTTTKIHTITTRIRPWGSISLIGKVYCYKFSMNGKCYFTIKIVFAPSDVFAISNTYRLHIF